ncbi:SDR family NAD(P)-dependent oxidoreductase [Pseudomonas veronii]
MDTVFMDAGQSLRLDGKTALVIGGSSGIGNGIAQCFRQQGATVHVSGTRVDASAYDDDEGSVLTGLHYSQLDVSSAVALQAWQPDIERLDILVLAQGAVVYRRQEFETETFNHVVNVNLLSVMQLATHFYPAVKESLGSMIFIGSIGAFKSVVGNPAYAASKAGLLGLTRTLGDAWGREGVRVNAIAPGMIATKMTEVTTQHPERLKSALDSISLGRLGQPADIANLALFLVSPLANYITGQTIIVDGGRSL